jgi:hypothetical protein
MKNLVPRNRGAEIFLKSRSHLNILGAGKVTLSKFEAEGPQILYAIVLNSDVWASWAAIEPAAFLDELIEHRLLKSYSYP